MGAEDAAFTALKALYTADSGGLSGTGSSSLRQFLREGDPNTSPNGVYAIVSVTPSRNYDGTSGGNTVMDVVFRVFLPPNMDFTFDNAVRGRLKTVYNGVRPSATGGFTFSPSVWLRSSDERVSDHRVLVEQYEMIASTVSGSLYGTDANFTGYDAGALFYWDRRTGLNLVDITGDDDDWATFDATHKTSGGVLRFYVETGFPPDPGLYEDVVFTAASGKTLTGDVWITDVRHVANIGAARAQVCEASWTAQGELA